MTDTPPNLPPTVPAEDLVGDRVQPGDPLFGIVWINPDRMSGEPCFFATRVPLKNLFDYIRAGESIEEFMDDFPGVTRKQIDEVLIRASRFFLPPAREGHAA